MSKLQHNIQRVLIERDVSLAKLAQLSGVPQSTLHRIMSGAIDEPRSSTIAPLAEFLGVPVQTLRDGDLSDQITFHRAASPAVTRASLPPPVTVGTGDASTPLTWDRDAHLLAFEGYFSNSVPREYLNWRSEIEGNAYRLDYCSERLAVDLIGFSRLAPPSHPRAGQLDFSTLFHHAASHLVDLFVIQAAFPNLKPLLLILCPAAPDERFPPVRKLMTSARRLGVDVRFATTGVAAAQAILKIESELLDDSASFSS